MKKVANHLSSMKIFLFILIFSNLVAAQTESSVKHPEWSRDKIIYEVNIRQYSHEGTFKAVEKELPRLKEMGVGILWLMPIHSIGVLNRKGTLGSYYAVKDYLDVNPEFGTKEDFRSLVKRTHELGMYLIIDWVANHTSWDNVLTKTNPGFFMKDSLGNFILPDPGWQDVIDLNYDNKELRKYMTDALIYWVKEFNIDGYRCDVADMVPVEFWNHVRIELDKIKPVFMLAEAENPKLHKAFNMTYSWNHHHLMNKIAKGDTAAACLKMYFENDKKKFPQDAYRMLFTTNHDENSWNGTEFERLGKGVKAFAVLTFTAPGMPLLYTGQETALNKRLNFFEKDPIDWKESEYKDFYTKLIDLKKNNKALLNGNDGGEIVFVETSNENEVLAFIREKGNDKILVILNLSDKEQNVSIRGNNLIGSYKDYFNNNNKSFSENEMIKLMAWDYKVFIR